MVNDAINTVVMKMLTDVSAGYPLRGSAESLKPGEARIIQMRNITPALQVDWASVGQVSLPTKRSPQWLESGDVIFAARGARNYAVCFDNLPPKTVCSPHFFVIRIRDKKTVLPSFLAWQINQKPAQEHFKRSATGSHILNIRREVIENLKIALPPIDQQRTIVKHFQAATAERNTLQELIENRNHEIEAIALGLFQNKSKG